MFAVAAFLDSSAISRLHLLAGYNLCYQTFLTNFEALQLTQFLTDFGQILDSKSYDQD